MSHKPPLIQLSAYEDIAAIADRIARYANKDASDRVVDQIVTGIELLGPTPYLGPLHHDPVLTRLGYRKLVLGKYIVVYRVENGRAIVLRVFHGSSDYVPAIECQ